jgi:predicted RecB family endonuclease
MRKLLTIILLSVTMLFSVAYLEAAVKVKVKATVETKKNKPKPEEIKAAVNNAKILAVKKYASEKDTRKRELVNELMPDIEKNIDNYILEINYFIYAAKNKRHLGTIVEVTIDDVFSWNC